MRRAGTGWQDERAPGTRKWLGNHRKMLSYTRMKVEDAVSKAESALAAASARAKEEPNAKNNAMVLAARHHLKKQVENLEWQDTRQKALDEEGIVLFDPEKELDPYELSEVERQWNRDFQEATATPKSNAKSKVQRCSKSVSDHQANSTADHQATSASDHQPTSASDSLVLTAQSQNSPEPAMTDDHQEKSVSDSTKQPKPIILDSDMGLDAQDNAGEVDWGSGDADDNDITPQAPVEAKEDPGKLLPSDGETVPESIAPGAPVEAKKAPRKPETREVRVALESEPKEDSGLVLKPNPRPPLRLTPAPNLNSQAQLADRHRKDNQRARSERPAMRERAASARKRRLPEPEHPMPSRLPPFVLEYRHQVSEEFDVDWTLHENWEIEQKRREERNILIKEKLLQGSSVAYRSSGWSMWPMIASNDCCTYEPVRHPNEVDEGDVVFCSVQPGDRYYAHKVLHKWFDSREGQFKWQIGNNRGYINGWCFLEHIYGKLVKVEQ